MEFVKMSRKGQLVVPQKLRVALGFKPEDRFIAYGENDYVVFKKVELEALKKEFEDVVKTTSEILKKRGVTPKVIEEEIQAHRRKKKTPSK